MRGMGTMGADCQPGYYRLKVFGVDTGQCLPTLSTAAGAAQAGVLSSAATGVASSPATQTAAQQAAIQAGGNAVFNYIKAHPYIVGGVALGLLFLVGRGLYK